MKFSTAVLLASSVLAGIAASTPALAVRAYATTHLNLRSGPGEQFPIVGRMHWNSHGDVSGCTADYLWCQISTANGVGWAAAYYLIEDTARGTETLQDFGAQSGIPVMVPEEVASEEVVRVGAVTPVALGSELIEAITPEPGVIEYVKATPVAAVHVTGEIVVGVVLPGELTLYEVPSSPYQYAVVNGATVLVEPATRKIVYVL